VTLDPIWVSHMGLYNSTGEKSIFLVLRSTHKKSVFLPPLMFNTHNHAVAPDLGKDELITANLPVCAAAPPVLLEAVKAIGLVAFLVCCHSGSSFTER